MFVDGRRVATVFAVGARNDHLWDETANGIPHSGEIHTAGGSHPSALTQQLVQIAVRLGCCDSAEEVCEHGQDGLANPRRWTELGAVFADRGSMGVVIALEGVVIAAGDQLAERLLDFPPERHGGEVTVRQPLLAPRSCATLACPARARSCVPGPREDEIDLEYHAVPIDRRARSAEQREPMTVKEADDVVGGRLTGIELLE